MHTRKCAHVEGPADLSEDLLVDGEGEVQHVVDVVVLHPLQALVELLIQVLQVAEVTRSRSRKGHQRLQHVCPIS